jgi:hypothetical protein
MAEESSVMIRAGGEAIKLGPRQHPAATFVGEILNLGPSQVYENQVTKEVFEQDFTGYQVVGGAIVPWYPTGFTPTTDLFSAAIYVAAPFLGIIDGIIRPLDFYPEHRYHTQDSEKGKETTHTAYSEIQAESKDRLEYLKQLVDLTKIEDELEPLSPAELHMRQLEYASKAKGLQDTIDGKVGESLVARSDGSWEYRRDSK